MHCLSVRAYILIHLSIYLSIYVCLCIHVYAYMYMYVYEYTYDHMHVYMYTLTHIDAQVYRHTCLCILEHSSTHNNEYARTHTLSDFCSHSSALLARGTRMPLVRLCLNGYVSREASYLHAQIQTCMHRQCVLFKREPSTIHDIRFGWESQLNDVILREMPADRSPAARACPRRRWLQGFVGGVDLSN